MRVPRALILLIALAASEAVLLTPLTWRPRAGFDSHLAPTRSHVASRHAVVTVDGLVCSACVRRLEERLAMLPAATSVTVDLALQVATIGFGAESTIGEEQIAGEVLKAVRATGIFAPHR